MIYLIMDVNSLIIIGSLVILLVVVYSRFDGNMANTKAYDGRTYLVINDELRKKSADLLARMREVDSSVLCPEKPHYRQQALQSKEQLRAFVHELMLPRAQRLAHHPVQSHARPLLPRRFECVLRAMELSSYTTRGI